MVVRKQGWHTRAATACSDGSLRVAPGDYRAEAGAEKVCGCCLLTRRSKAMPVPTSQTSNTRSQVGSAIPGSTTTAKNRVAATNGQDVVDRDLADLRQRCVERPRLTVQHGVVIRRCRAQRFDPLFDPTDRTAEGIGQVRQRPLSPTASACRRSRRWCCRLRNKRGRRTAWRSRTWLRDHCQGRI